MPAMLPQVPPEPGWYPDPWDPASTRWWDGQAWTGHISRVPFRWAPSDGYGSDPDPGEPTGWFPPLRPLPAAAAVLATALVALVTAGNAVVAGTTDLRVVSGSVGLATLVISTFGFPAAGLFASWRWGSKNLGRDLGLRARWIDLPIGLAGAFVLTVTVVVGGLLVEYLDLPKGTNLDDVESAGRNPLLFLLLAVLAGVVAPITEEILFRGVLLRGLSSRFGPKQATMLQAAVFGCAHLTISQGWGNVTMIAILGTVGLALGVLAQLTGRLAPGMVAHSLFNLGQLSLLWLTLG